MLEGNVPGLLFGLSGTNKGDYVKIITRTNEFYEGLIRWAYITLLARPPETAEVYTAMLTFTVNKDLELVMMNIMKTDEYANFK